MKTVFLFKKKQKKKLFGEKQIVFSTVVKNQPPKGPNRNLAPALFFSRRACV